MLDRDLFWGEKQVDSESWDVREIIGLVKSPKEVEEVLSEVRS